MQNKLEFFSLFSNDRFNHKTALSSLNFFSTLKPTLNSTRRNFQLIWLCVHAYAFSFSKVFFVREDKERGENPATKGVGSYKIYCYGVLLKYFSCIQPFNYYVLLTCKHHSSHSNRHSTSEKLLKSLLRKQKTREAAETFLPFASRSSMNKQTLYFYT